MPFAFKSRALEFLPAASILSSAVTPNDIILCFSSDAPFKKQFLIIDGKLFLSHQQLQSVISNSDNFLVLGKLHHQRVLLLSKNFTHPDHLTVYNEQSFWFDMRYIAACLDAEQATLAATAYSLNYWHTQNQFCSRCGHQTKLGHEHARECLNKDCNLVRFPRIDPAVIMSVINDKDEILLGRQANWDENRFSVVAGFLSHGETLEACVAREVKEETGVIIASCKYVASQPWPFPSSIMIGFCAHAKKQLINTADDELETAIWISRQELVKEKAAKNILLSPKLSISRYLIELWFNE